MSRLTRGLGLALAVLLLTLVPRAQARFIPIFNITQMNASAWHLGDEVSYAKYVMIDIDRTRYNQIYDPAKGKYTYDLIHALNPTEVIAVYEQGPRCLAGLEQRQHRI